MRETQYEEDFFQAAGEAMVEEYLAWYGEGAAPPGISRRGRGSRRDKDRKGEKRPMPQQLRVMHGELESRKSYVGRLTEDELLRIETRILREDQERATLRSLMEQNGRPLASRRDRLRRLGVE